MKKILVFLVLVVGVLFLSGCWGVEEESPRTFGKEIPGIESNTGLYCDIIDYDSLRLDENFDSYCKQELGVGYGCVRAVLKQNMYSLEGKQTNCEGDIQAKSFYWGDYSYLCNQDFNGESIVMSAGSCYVGSCSEEIGGEKRECTEPALGDIYFTNELPFKVTCCKVE